MNAFNAFERLERRVLLAHIGPDLNFGGLGFAQADAELLVAPQAGGKILVAGYDQANGVGTSRVARLNADGSIDTTFTPGPAPADEIGVAQAIVIGQRLLIVSVARAEQTPPAPLTLLVRALDIADGSPDETFGDAGIVRITPEAPDPADGGVFQINPTDALATTD